MGRPDAGEAVLACCADCDSAARDAASDKALLQDTVSASADTALLRVVSNGDGGCCSGWSEASEVAPSCRADTDSVNNCAALGQALLPDTAAASSDMSLLSVLIIGWVGCSLDRNEALELAGAC